MADDKKESKKKQQEFDVKGLLIKRRGQRATVRVDRERSRRKIAAHTIDCWNSINAQIGDNVNVNYRMVDEKKLKLVTYITIPVSVIAGVTFGHGMATFLGWHEYYYHVVGVSTLLWFIVGWSYYSGTKRDVLRGGVQPVIDSIEEVEYEIDMTKDKGAGFLG